MIWVRLRLPGCAGRRVPLPAAADRPGDRAGRRARAGLRLGRRTSSGASSLTLCFAYTVLVLPYAYRAIDAGLAAIDVRTLAEAARCLGAGWATRDRAGRAAEHPHRRAVGRRSSSVALVLGEFTIAIAAQPHQPAGRDQPARQERRRPSRSPSRWSRWSSPSCCCSSCRSPARRRRRGARRPHRPRRDPRPLGGHPVSATTVTRRTGTPAAPSGSRTCTALRRRAGAGRARPRHRARRAGRAARPVGLRQDDRAAGARRAGGRRPPAGSSSAARTSPTCPANKRDMGMVFQAYSLFPHLTALQNVEFGLRLRGVERGASAGGGPARCSSWSASARTAERYAAPDVRRPAAARRAGPRAGDPARGCCCSTSRCPRSTRRCASSCATRSGGSSSRSARPALFVTHDQEEALAVADRVGVMRAGRLEQLGAPREVYQRPATAFVAEFVGLTSKRVGDGPSG